MIRGQYFTHFENPSKNILPSGWQKHLDKVLQRVNDKLVELELTSDEDDHLIELNLMSNKEIQEVNLALRGIEKPTDVLSLRFNDDIDAPSLPGEIFGEIHISLEKCAEQAKEIGQTFMEELAFLFVHGILHIFEYDHINAEDEKVMMSIAYEILGRG